MKPFVIIAAVLGGCAFSSGHDRGPHGRPIHYITAGIASAAFEEAESLCPHGYDVIPGTELRRFFDYAMTVECKAEPPVFLSTTDVPPVNPEKGFYTQKAMSLPEVRACAESPAALQLVTKLQGWEKYSISCANGNALQVQCDPGRCWVAY
ncbi:MAG: hypothetical protein LBR95_02245 [Azoarcus sp.]|nr:hypothetical protein [Azoarcus sp.]